MFPNYKAHLKVKEFDLDFKKAQVPKPRSQSYQTEIFSIFGY
jgi:hypothetical protein